MKNLRKSLLLIFALLAFGQTAWAQNNYIECSWDAENKTVVQTPRDIPSGTTSVTSSTTTLSGWHEVSGNVTINGNVRCEGDARLILHDNAHLRITGGLTVNKTSNNSLTIYCQSYGDSMGKLTVTCDTDLWNGIGGCTVNGQKKPHGTITIHGGNIKTTGGPCAVGLGSILSGSSPITIFGGRVEAHAGIVEVSIAVNELACPGIGIVGNGGSGASLIVYGGDVYAYGASDAAGIGGCDGKPKYLSGDNSDGGIINIYGGYVEAHGGDYGAGIGGGQNGNGGSVTINGGTVKAWGGTDAAGIGSGEQKEGAKNGGTVIINGGYVEAHGGKYGAGIGGGQDASGATVTVTGGTVNAYGGTDAAGIGSGEEVTAGAGAINGGTLTVTGGYVFADGTGWGAGIGGGEDANGANVTISGGTVIAWAGSDAGNKNGSAIGSEMGDGHRGTLHIGDSLMVHAGQDANHLSFFTAPERVPACYYRPYTRIEPCNHQGATYTINGTDINGTHTLHCSHCTYTPTHTHTFENGVCTVCGVSGTVCTVDVYLPIAGEGNNNYSYNTEPSFTYQLVQGSTFELPAPPASQLPAGVRFVGWRVGSPSELGLTSPLIGENETVLPAGTEYTVESDVSFTPRYKTFHVFTTAGNWNDATNWCWNTVPTIDKEIVIAAEATVPAEYTAQLGNSVTIDLGGSLTIADGGQLKHSTAVPGTIQKFIAGYGDISNPEGWYLLGAPLRMDSALAVNSGMVDLVNDQLDFTTHGIDLYQFSQNQDFEWRNMRGDNRFSSMGITVHAAYLYARADDCTLNFSTTEDKLFAPTTSDTYIIATRAMTTPEPEFVGWNLIRNPYTCNAYLASGRDFYRMNATHDAIVLATAENGGSAIKPCEGIFVVVGEHDIEEQYTNPITGITVSANIQMTTTEPQPSGSKGMLDITVKQGDLLADAARVRFGHGERTGKLVLRDEATRLSIMQDGKDCSVVYNETQGEMPVNFKAKENGTYTLTVNPENVEMGYLHLIDNMTGNDVDLLQTPSYSFEVKTTDYASRFKLVFSANTEDGPSTGSGTFAFVSNGEIIVNGEGVLQVIDMTGRVIVSRSGDVSGNVSTNGMTPGVYVLRLINGDIVKTQKMVIQ